MGQERKDFVGNDCRSFGLDSQLMKELKDGRFKPFVDFVKTTPELELCFRKNSSHSGNVIIYFNNHIVWDLTYSKNNPSVGISVNHLRYYEKWRELIANLENEYKFSNRVEIKVVKTNIKNNDSQSYALNITKLSSRKTFCTDDIKNMYDKYLHPMMESYFDEKCTKDYFLEEVKKESLRDKNLLVEKRRQQQIFSANTNRENGFYIYDLEFSQKFYSQSLKYEYENRCKEQFGDKATANEPDMLAVRYENGKPIALAFIEVKSTESAMKGDSGCDKHMWGMKYYVETNINKFSLMENRKEEAYLTLRDYKHLGLHNTGIKDIEEEIKNLNNIERYIILTDKAAAYYRKKKTDIDNIAKETGTSIIVLKDDDMVLAKDKIEKL